MKYANDKKAETSKEASRRAKESLEDEKSKRKAQDTQPEVSIKAVRNSVAKAAWGSAVLRPPKEESEESSSSSDEDSSDDKDDIEAPEGGKEIKSEPPSRRQSLSPERTEMSVRTETTVRLEPWRKEKTMTTDKRVVPIKKDPITKLTKEITKLTKEDLKKSTSEFVKLRTEQRFKRLGWLVTKVGPASRVIFTYFPHPAFFCSL